MAFTAADVKNLREMTGVGMMDCKMALTASVGDMDEAVENAFRYDRLVLASITDQGEICPFMSTFIHTLAEHAYQTRTVALVEAGSWAPAAAKVMTKELEGMKDITLAQNKVTVLGSLNDASRAQIEALADELSK